MEGVISQLSKQQLKGLRPGDITGADQSIDMEVDSSAFQQRLAEKIRERGSRSHLMIPRVAPDLMIGVEAFSGGGDLIRHNLRRGDGML